MIMTRLMSHLLLYELDANQIERVNYSRFWMLIVLYNLQKIEHFIQGSPESVHQHQVLAPWHHSDSQHHLLDVQYRGLRAVRR